MNLEHAYVTTHAAFHCYEFYWWCGTCTLLLITTFFLLRSRRVYKDAQQLRSLNTELQKNLQHQEAALSQAQKQEALFQQIAENLPDAVVITEPTGSILYSNAVAQQKTGYTKNELLSQPISLLLPEVVIGQQQTEPTIQVTRKDRTAYPASVTLTLLRNQDQEKEKEALGTLFLLKDQSIHQQKEQIQATEQKEFLARLRKARGLETIGLMTGEAAHDLNNILSGVLHHPEQILRNLPENSPLRPSLVSLQRSGQQAVALVADLLSAARAGSAIKEVTDLNGLVKKILEEKEQQNIFTKRAGVSLRNRLCSDLLPINCSPPHIRQCLHNLLLNGCDTIHAGSRVGTITVSVDSRYVATPPPAASSASSPGEYAILSVADTGPCLSATDRAHIFEPFYSKKILKRQGTGIALALLRNVMEEHDGWVDIPDKTNQGNRFDLYFPIRPVQNTSLKKEGQRILIIGKDKEKQEKLIDFLTGCGYKALSVGDNAGALSYLNRNKVELVIVNMADDQRMEGNELYGQILFLHPSQKAVLITTSPTSRPDKESPQPGNMAFLQPDFKQQELHTALQKLLSN